MKQSLQLRIGQHLTMTPQLQQAIRLLQLSTLELQSEIQEALESNPLLEDVAESEATESPSEVAQSSAGEAGLPASADEAATTTADPQDQVVDLQDTRIPDELPVDSSWEDIYETLPATTPASSAADDSRAYENQGPTVKTLHDHLLWQMQLTPFSESDLIIAESILDSIDEDGYLSTRLEEIHQGLDEQLEIEFDEVEAVLHRIHCFDPIGVGAANLRECLLLQLQQMESAAPGVSEAIALVDEHLALLGSRDFTQLMRRMRLSSEQLQRAIEVVQSLNPRPGSLVATAHAEYIVPDVHVRKVTGRWRVELNVEAMPRLRVNAHYAGMVRRADSSSDNTYIKNQLQEARWFIKSLASRNETLLKVASSIVERQRGFLEHGEEAMKALVLYDIAEELGMHESTISRVTTRKYMHTPRGIFELKYFFSSHVSTATGGSCSSTAIRALIKKMVAAENVVKPLSDNKIAMVLSDQGINVARRTVAKYREAMMIPPSNERKQLI